jgi:hypothetical protein
MVVGSIDETGKDRERTADQVDWYSRWLEAGQRWGLVVEHLSRHQMTADSVYDRYQAGWARRRRRR